MRQGAAVTVVFALRDVAPINPLIETSIASGGACPHPPLQGAPLRAGKRGARDSAANDAGFPPLRE